VARRAGAAPLRRLIYPAKYPGIGSGRDPVTTGGGVLTISGSGDFQAWRAAGACDLAAVLINILPMKSRR
jgi:hypothetical protein